MSIKFVLPLVAIFTLTAASASAAPGASTGPAAETPGHAQALSQCSGSLGAFPQDDSDAPGNSASQNGTNIAAGQQAAHSDERACTVGALPADNRGKKNN